jgi:hypothetical protein
MDIQILLIINLYGSTKCDLLIVRVKCAWQSRKHRRSLKD